ncbi:MAG: hypothetical protein ACHRXM_37670 [Isosphaerales bacterium]
MRRSIRFSIAGLMGAVLIAALGLAALRSASATAAGMTLLATCGVLGLAVVGVVCRQDGERAWWLGFAVFGWGYMALAFLSPNDSATLPTLTLLKAVFTRMGMTVSPLPPGPQIGGRNGRFGWPATGGVTPSFDQTGHCLWALLAASLGGILARSLFASPALRSDKATAETQPAERAPPMVWHGPAVVGLTGFGLVAMVAVAVAGLTLRFWAGVTLLLTCGLGGLAVLGALVGRGRRREIWLGAAVFGFGYLMLAFGWQRPRSTWPQVATGQLLENIRPWLPSYLSGFPITPDRTSPANARILQELERPVPMRFPTATPLEDVLKHIKNATRGPDGKGIPVYVDPIGLQEAEKSMTSTVFIDWEGAPLKASLQLCLKQLGLAYIVKDGFLMITSEDESLPIFEDPFMIVGHCLFAMIAAILGAAAAPLVAGRRGQT